VNRRILAILALTFGTMPVLQAKQVAGSVFLMPIGSSGEFRSVGHAEFLNDLNHIEYEPLHGTHSVSGPQVFLHEVSGNGLYDYTLEGPADPGECYSTELYAYADPSGPQFYSKTFFGPSTRCASSSTPGGGGDLDVCDHCEPGTMEPLVLDLNGDGIWTTSIHDDPVWFDLNGDGRADRTGWTTREHEDGFLYVDWNGNRTIDGGQELFGDATILPSGNRAQHGFEALAAYDQADVGGDGDGVITRRDRIWSKLRVWVDRNHDGLASHDENATLASAGVVGIALQWRVMGPNAQYGEDANGNLHLLQGTHEHRVRGEVRQLAMHEIYFLAQ